MPDINYDNRCYICMKVLMDYMMLPYEEDFFGNEISIFKDTMIVKNVEPFQFLYFKCCSNCIDNYINFKSKKNINTYLHERELNGK